MTSTEPNAPTGGRQRGTTSAARTSSAPSDTPSVRPKARPGNLRRAPMLFRVAMGLFFVGGLALLAVLVMFASGVRDFPLWLWLVVALAPVGLVVGSFGVRKAGLSVGS